MKKLLYLLLVLNLFSCSSSGDNTDDTLSPIEHMEKAYVYCTDGIGTGPSPQDYYEFTYENGSLTKIKGRFYPVFMQMFDKFFSEPITKLTYSGNTVTVSEFELGTIPGYDEYRYTMNNNRPVKQENYYINNSTGASTLSFARTYTYEQDKLKSVHLVFPGPGNYEYFTTYYYDNSNNLTKSEFLERINGVDNKMTTAIYSDFDNAANPFKKLYLINDTFFEKSLSVNNFRKKETTVVNLVLNIPPKTSTKTWNYKYDANGQVLLYFPF
ncbi:hypothetical protein HNP24_004036 [Chryseobacterium sediminis]|uniref:DUF4595 domain-containing protein n=1 Tax=Chryseobacterium sediminis TaxID=1679494 RepID=A0ABR6Q650_9FLAO|nr:hypothetical protein [Chryseobacterium sediminis]MBB6333033.1 hypothetical protein [Chryseobacterium sediminis]